MKNIKLVMLVSALILSAAGGYAKYRLSQQMYYIEPFTSSSSEYFKIAAEPPSMDCAGTGGNYVCTISAASGFAPGDDIPFWECTVISSYTE